MSKRWPWILVLVLAAGCNNEVGPTVTADEQDAIEKLHNASIRKPGTEGGINYLVWEGVTVTDPANNPVRVVRVKFRVGNGKETPDILYRFADGKVLQNRLNGSGDHWHEEAQIWIRRVNP